MAITPDSHDFDLRVEDPATGAQLATSTASFDPLKPAVDFVAVDSNRRPFGGYVAAVDRFNNPTAEESDYRVSFVEGNHVLSNGTETVHLGAGQPVAVFDLFVNLGDTVTITVAPQTPGTVPAVFLMQSRPDNPNLWVQGRVDAARAAVTTKLQQTVATSSFTAGTQGYYGVVLANESPLVAGDYRITVTRTAKTP
ncbi:hypothetical protein [Dactylosporangium sp. NPDC051541]|uniref:hypothetical protein n=1 Tax=Dactylosporangium sp. NPDC051541 TaxID=3363977 RepID=UPI003795B33E